MKKLFFTIALFGALINANAQYYEAQNSYIDKQGQRDALGGFASGLLTTILQNLYNASFSLGEVTVEGRVEKQYSNAGLLVPINMNGISKRRNWDVLYSFFEKGGLALSINDFSIPFNLNEEHFNCFVGIEPRFRMKSIGFSNRGILENHSSLMVTPSLIANLSSKKGKIINATIYGMVGYDININKLSLIEDINGNSRKGEKIFRNNFNYSVGTQLFFFNTLYLGVGYTSDFGNLFKDPNINYTYRAITTNAGVMVAF